MIDKQLDILRQPRLKILSILDGFSLEQLNTIPTGYNNNIIWNLGHMVAAQQGVCYKRAGVGTRISDGFFQSYKPDSKPDGFVDAAGFEEIKSLLTTSLDDLKQDLEKEIFGNYPAWTTRYGVEITSIEDAIAFLPFHEGLHIGYIMAMRKLV
jgi:hypothetical protein